LTTVFIGLRRYGLLGLNGCGKSTLLTAIGCRELPIPHHMDIYHLTHEIQASDMSALQAVVTCDEERVKLEKEAEILAAQVRLLPFRLHCNFSPYNIDWCGTVSFVG
jgi:ATPase subunit of ABC transporter with duplicated ATPase domains